jgi:putative peptidoglycan lipid II flippase
VSVARSSLIMASGTIISRVLGFARAVLLAAMLGVTTNAADAFGIANQLPNNVYAIIAGGVLNAVLVPQLVRARNHPDDGAGYINRLLTMGIVVFGSITVIATVAAPLLVNVYTSGWKPEQLALAVAFAYWCLPQLFFYAIYSMLGEVLNSRSEFGPYMWAPVLNNVVALLGMGAYIWLFGMDPTGQRSLQHWGLTQISLLAGTATLGVASQAAILFLSWRRIGIRFRPNFQWRGFGMRPALKAGIWTLAMVLVTQIAGIFQSAVASSAVTGRTNGAVASVAASGIAWLIFMLPHSVFTVSLATVYFTRISTHAHNNAMHLVKADLLSGLKVTSLISILASVALAQLAYPISRIFVGEYEATLALGNVLICFLIGLLPFSLGFFLQKAFYALEDTKTPFWIAVIQSGLYIVGSLLILVSAAPAQRVAFLALLTSATVTVQAILGYVILRKRIGVFGASLLPSILRFLAAAGLGGLLGHLVLQLLGGTSKSSFSMHSVLGGVTSAALTGLAILFGFVVTLFVIRAPEVKMIAELARPIAAKIRGIIGR